MMKKILFVSDNKINGYGGGSIENRKYYMALKKYCKTNGDILKVISMDDDIQEKFGIKIKKNKMIDIGVRLQGHSSYLYQTWNDSKKMIVDFAPDLIVLGRSRLGFIAKSIKRELPNCKVITNVDNVEIDYVDAYFANKNGIVSTILRGLEKKTVKKDELDTIKYSDRLIFLTKRNVKRYRKVYRHTEKNPVIIPICLENSILLEKESEHKNVVFIGSLDYAANENAVCLFIEKVWIPFFSNREDIRLIIAGRNPRDTLVQLVNQCHNVTLVKNFKSLQQIVPKKSMIVAPIQQGAGMKVKVAETLSMGLMIAGSDEALVGYENAIVKDNLGGIIRANSPEEYKQAVFKFYEKSDKDLERISKQNKKIYEDFYSYKLSYDAIEKVCSMILSEQS